MIEARDAKAGLSALAKHPEVSLLFTDVVMPEMNGRQLAAEALQRRPDLKILFTTGYTRNAVVHNGVLDPEVNLLQKPASLEQLAAKVREVLDRGHDILCARDAYASRPGARFREQCDVHH